MGKQDGEPPTGEEMLDGWFLLTDRPTHQETAVISLPDSWWDEQKPYSVYFLQHAVRGLTNTVYTRSPGLIKIREKNSNNMLNTLGIISV